ncbi:HNH endonuclease [Escherichia coli]|uniref:HNH endonuclease n=1 Tax=Escherichia coli TaxID=562 RepID=UPI001BFC594E|nr:HNH endonuclease [Escherichia coli]
MECVHDWHYRFEYYERHLIWKRSPRRGIAAGSNAGTINNKGRVIIKLKGGMYPASRIIWEMHNGPIPEGYEIDHIDHNTRNDSINNLRLVSHVENLRNKSKHKNNTSGYTGIIWVKGCKKWRAYITVNGDWRNLGYFDDIRDAVKAREKAEIEFGFHRNHGK